MVKVIFLFRFRADRDPEEVRTWWLNDHGKIALRNLGMLRYVQNHFVGAIDEAHAGAGLGYDGCVEVWFKDREAYEQTMASPDRKALEGDGPNGLDMTSLMAASRWSTSCAGTPNRTGARTRRPTARRWRDRQLR